MFCTCVGLEFQTLTHMRSRFRRFFDLRERSRPMLSLMSKVYLLSSSWENDEAPLSTADLDAIRKKIWNQNLVSVVIQLEKTMSPGHFQQENYKVLK